MVECEKPQLNVISWSGGKDSTATIIVAKHLNIQIDKIIISLPMFDKTRNIYADHPEHVEWVLNFAKPLIESWGYPIDIVTGKIEREHITGKLIHLCFTCDPYPTGYDSTPTREIIKIIKESGNHVQILTKGDGRRDFDLLDEHDWYGITLDGIASDTERDRVWSLCEAHSHGIHGIRTWVSFEPVVNERRFFSLLHCISDVTDKVKIGKLNYYSSDIDWKSFGEKAERLCKELGLNYYIKDSLKKEMGI